MSPDREPRAGPRASENVTDEYQPLTNWDYRGAMDPNLVKDRSESSSLSGADQGLEGGLSGSSATGDVGGRDFPLTRNIR